MRTTGARWGRMIFLLALVGTITIGSFSFTHAAEAFKMGVVDPQAVLEKSKAGRRALDGLKDYVSTRQKLLSRDEEDLRNTQPFVLTSDQLPLYDIRYLGKQNADEISCYVFAVKPKKLTPGKRFFEGQIWVDDRDLQIVKTYGKGVGFLKKGDDQQFPKFETLREQIDGKYWFPTYTHADDVLHFKDHDQRIKMLVTYKDYKKFQGKSSIHFGEVVDDGKTKNPPQKPQPKP